MSNTKRTTASIAQQPFSDVYSQRDSVRSDDQTVTEQLRMRMANATIADPVDETHWYSPYGHCIDASNYMCANSAERQLVCKETDLPAESCIPKDRMKGQSIEIAFFAVTVFSSR
ncbi:unnamed protein product [Gongylonema pulchrum]|uniref:Kringle domain-containing protein n=1 Tax=Gongylonema pulchrum TaxID=637853 RepID=A0A183E3Y5_9BILA|nr:unnamed protein product [Gongylonema pulchrum]